VIARRAIPKAFRTTSIWRKRKAASFERIKIRVDPVQEGRIDPTEGPVVEQVPVVTEREVSRKALQNGDLIDLLAICIDHPELRVQDAFDGCIGREVVPQHVDRQRRSTCRREPLPRIEDVLDDALVVERHQVIWKEDIDVVLPSTEMINECRAELLDQLEVVDGHHVVDEAELLSVVAATEVVERRLREVREVGRRSDRPPRAEGSGTEHLSHVVASGTATHSREQVPASVRGEGIERSVPRGDVPGLMNVRSRCAVLKLPHTLEAFVIAHDAVERRDHAEATINAIAADGSRPAAEPPRDPPRAGGLPRFLDRAQHDGSERDTDRDRCVDAERRSKDSLPTGFAVRPA
jgi:hypothetical protein